MSHVVKDLAESVSSVRARCVCYTYRIEEEFYFRPASPGFAEWVNGIYRGRWVNTDSFRHSCLTYSRMPARRMFDV